MPLTSSVPREQAGSLTLSAPPSRPRTTAAENAKAEVLECGGNTQIMEARLCQITSSVRALIRSNHDLEEALKSAPGDADFLQAITENQLIIRKQGQAAVVLVAEMQAHGCNVELEEDIQTSVLEDAGPITAVIFGGENAAEQPSERNGVSNNNNNTEPGGGGGMYL